MEREMKTQKLIPNTYGSNRRCKECGWPHHRADSAFCSDECAKDWYQQNNEKKYPKNMGYIGGGKIGYI